MNIHAEQLLEHPIERSDDGVEADGQRRFEHRTAAENQELPCEGRSPTADFEHLAKIVLQIGIHRLVVADLSQGELRVANECGQKIVEIVGDASSQPAQRFHFL